MASKEVKATFRKKDGKIIMLGRKMWEREMEIFPDGDIIGVFRAPKKLRTNLQNSFYFGCFIYAQMECIEERWGVKMTVSQMHDWNKSNVWCEEIIVGDEVVRIPDTSTNKTTTEWEEKLEICRQFFMLNFEWPLPYPNEQETIKFL